MAFTNDDILTLAKAGFNAQQIAALSSLQAGAGNNNPSQSTAPAQAVQNPAPELSNNVQTNPVNAPTTPVNAQAPATAPATIDDVMKQISGLSQQIQIGNLQNAQQPKPVTAEDILAEIINPPAPTPKP